jgi:hypothetical protein
VMAHFRPAEMGGRSGAGPVMRSGPASGQPGASPVENRGTARL